jgi:YidC/Oxa1 family membrane protein insertase
VFVLAFNPIEPITAAMTSVLNAIHMVVPSYGWDMVLLAIVVRLALFPLAQQQFKSMAEMQKVQPLLKAIQAKHKGNPQELQAATMALYKEHGVNPLAGCFPMLIQLPLLLGLFYAINSQLDKYATGKFLWIGSSLADAVNPAFESFKANAGALGEFFGIQTQVDAAWAKAQALQTATEAAAKNAELHHLAPVAVQVNHVNPYGVVHVFAPGLAYLDLTLFILYIVSMYISVRYGSPPSSDPQQAQTQKIMAVVSPVMIAYFGFTNHWASALLIYWLTLNVLTMAQQFFMYRKYGLIGGPKPAVVAAPAPPIANAKSSKREALPGGKNGSTSGRSRRSKR